MGARVCWLLISTNTTATPIYVRSASHPRSEDPAEKMDAGVSMSMNTLSRREEETLVKTAKAKAMRECDPIVKRAFFFSCLP